jgi:hypothetical protein
MRPLPTCPEASRDALRDFVQRLVRARERQAAMHERHRRSHVVQAGHQERAEAVKLPRHWLLLSATDRHHSAHSRAGQVCQLTQHKRYLQAADAFPQSASKLPTARCIQDVLMHMRREGAQAALQTRVPRT